MKPFHGLRWCLSLPVGAVLLGSSFGAVTKPTGMPPPTATELWGPIPPVVTATEGQAPSDAIVLFDGKSLDAWEPVKPGSKGWNLVDGLMVIAPGQGDIRTKVPYGSLQLHLEYREPIGEKDTGQHRGNSGVIFMDLYQLQILDSYQNPTFVNGQAGSVYKQYAPLVNACRPPGVWQTYDAVFITPRFAGDGTLLRPAQITLFHNGVMVLHDVSLLGPTVRQGLPHYKPHADKLPLALQGHHDPVAFRNIWIREIKLRSGN